MVFIDQGSASTLQQHTHTIAQAVSQSTGQLLLLLLKLKSQSKPLPSLNHECAEAAESLLRSQGAVTPLENGRTASRVSVGNYELQADLDDRSGRPTVAVYDLESGEKVLSARRTAKGDYELQTVNRPLSLKQKQAFLSQLQQTLQGEVVSGMTGLERLQAMTSTLEEQAPRGCKAMLVADALLGGQREAADQQYTYTRGEDGVLSIRETKTDSLVAVMSPTGTIDQALSQRDQTYFKQAYERLRLAERYRQTEAAVIEPEVALSLEPQEAQPQAEQQALAVTQPTAVTMAVEVLDANFVEPSGQRRVPAREAAPALESAGGDLAYPQAGVALVVGVEVVEGEFMEPPGQRRIQARVAALGLESAGGDLALYVGAQLVAQQGGQEYRGERYQVTAYGNGAMTIHATRNPVPLVYANSAGAVTSQLTPEQTSQFRQMYQSLTQPQVAAPALATGRSATPRALKSARSFDLGGR